MTHNDFISIAVELGTFGILFLIVSVWLIERIVSVEVAAYLWAILSIITAVGLLKIIILKTFTKFIVNVLSGLLFLYSGLQIYGVNINKNFKILKNAQINKR